MSSVCEIMTDHPCKDMTKAQREAFERIAVNQHPCCTWPTIDALLKAGLIERGEPEVRRDAMGVYEIPNFYVPLPVHAQWCEWCGNQREPRHGGEDLCHPQDPNL